MKDLLLQEVCYVSCLNRKCFSPVNGTGSGSGSGHSSGSAGIGGRSESRQETSAINPSQDSYKPPVLTEALLFRWVKYSLRKLS
jgi:hypothetical protein